MSVSQNSNGWPLYPTTNHSHEKCLVHKNWNDNSVFAKYCSSKVCEKLNSNTDQQYNQQLPYMKLV